MMLLTFQTNGCRPFLRPLGAVAGRGSWSGVRHCEDHITLRLVHTRNDHRPSTRWLALAGTGLLVCAHSRGGDVGAFAVENRDRRLAKNILRLVLVGSKKRISGAAAKKETEEAVSRLSQRVRPSCLEFSAAKPKYAGT